MIVKLAPDLLEAALRSVPGFELAGPPEALSGGNLNQVWRLRGRERSLILKYAPPYVATNPTIPLSPDRLAFEARALGLFSPGARFHALASEAIRPPQLVHFDAGAHFILMEDIGAGSDLAAATECGSTSPRTSHELGTFIAKLHRHSLCDSTLQRSFDNRNVQGTRLKVQYLAAAKYARLVDVASVTRVGENAAALGHALLAPGRCLVMGDLWPPSVLVGQGSLHLIDWEFAHYGRPLQDIAHFGAHCWMQSQTAANRETSERMLGVWASFIAGYKEAAGAALSELLAQDEERYMNVHAGAEILMRSVGPFVRGYRYDGLPANHRLIREARDQAVHLLAAPMSTFFMGF